MKTEQKKKTFDGFKMFRLPKENKAWSFILKNFKNILILKKYM